MQATGTHPLRVAVVGGGVAGLSSAVFLARAGHEVRVFERLPGIVPGGTGILLEPAGLEVLRRMDLADAAHALNPQLGLGATMALLDAECVARCLQESIDVCAAFARFETLRRPHVARYARVSAIWSRLDGTGFSPLRRWLFRGTANGPAFLRRRLLHHVCGYASLTPA